MPEAAPRETPATAIDFRGLTPLQRDLLDQQGWSPRCGHKQPHKRTALPLVERNLLVRGSVQIGLATITTYEVPPAVLLAWRALKDPST